MKKLLLPAGMLAFIIAVCALSNTGALYAVPLQTPAEFLASMPYITFPAFGRELVLIQPSSTFFVYLLGAMMVVLGAYFYGQNAMKNPASIWASVLCFGASARWRRARATRPSGMSSNAGGRISACSQATGNWSTCSWPPIASTA